MSADDDDNAYIEDSTDDIPMTTTEVDIPVDSTVVVVLARYGTDLWCAGYDTPAETRRHLKAALRKLEAAMKTTKARKE